MSRAGLCFFKGVQKRLEPNWSRSPTPPRARLSYARREGRPLTAAEAAEEARAAEGVAEQMAVVLEALRKARWRREGSMSFEKREEQWLAAKEGGVKGRSF